MSGAVPGPRWAEPLAIIGLSCRFPGGASSPQQYWDLLRRGGDAVVPVPTSRWPGPTRVEGAPTRWAGLLDAVDEFDAGFLKIPPREADRLDPRQALILELAWEALEDAAIPPDTLAGTRTGVFVGISGQEHPPRGGGDQPQPPDPYALTGAMASVAAGRVAHLLGLRGPAVAVDTASSSSLVAVHLAGQSLRTGESRVVLAAAVNLLLSPQTTADLGALRTLSPTGRCRAFDASADGYVRGEGAGVLVLKRLSDAQCDGDEIRALICGSAVNHDGPSTGLTAPDPAAQIAVIADALGAAGLTPADLSYIEAHGTGTPVGDPVEAAALAAALSTAEGGPAVVVGSVKTNIGHLEAAAGMAGLIKVVLALEHEKIPRHLHLTALNPALDPALGLAGTRMVVPAEERAWPRTAVPRRAGVSAFGLAGTNAHVILAEAPAQSGPAAATPRPAAAVVSPADPSPVCLLPLSAPEPVALAQLAGRYADHLTARPRLPLDDLCRTAGEGRTHFVHRLAILAGSPEEARYRLRAVAAGRMPDDSAVSRPGGRPPRLAVLFSGQGAQYRGMGRELYRTQPVFRDSIDRCDDLLGVLPGGQRLRAVLFAAGDGADPLDQAGCAQPALFALEWSLWTLWRSWGIRPDVVLGHSLGELVAACAAGALTLEQGLRLVAERGRLMQELPADGAMMSVAGDVRTVEEAVAGRLDPVIAAYNHPGQVVVSGRRPAVDQLADQLSAQGLTCTPLAVSHAFHSPLIDPALDAFEAAAAGLVPGRAQPEPGFGGSVGVAGAAGGMPGQVPDPVGITMISTLTGEPVGPGDLDAGYWRRQAREPVRFMAAIRRAEQRGVTVLLECGPHPVLLGLAGQSAVDPAGLLAVPTLHRGRDDTAMVLRGLGMLYAAGVDVDWAGVGRHRGRRRTGLPGYPFQRQSYGAGRRATSLPALPDHGPVRDLRNRRDSRDLRDVRDQLAGGEPQSAPELLARRASRLVPGADPEPGAALLDLVCAEVAAVLGHQTADAVDPVRAFKDFGVDSRAGLDLRQRLIAATGLPLPTTLVYDHPTPAAVAAALRAASRSPTGPGSPVAPSALSGPGSSVVPGSPVVPDALVGPAALSGPGSAIGPEALDVPGSPVGPEALGGPGAAAGSADAVTAPDDRPTLGVELVAAEPDDVATALLDRFQRATADEVFRFIDEELGLPVT